MLRSDAIATGATSATLPALHCAPPPPLRPADGLAWSGLHTPHHRRLVFVRSVLPESTRQPPRKHASKCTTREDSLTPRLLPPPLKVLPYSPPSPPLTATFLRPPRLTYRPRHAHAHTVRVSLRPPSSGRPPGASPGTHARHTTTHTHKRSRGTGRAGILPAPPLGQPLPPPPRTLPPQER